MPRAARILSSMPAAFFVCTLASLASLFATSPLAHEPPPVSPAGGRASRKVDQVWDDEGPCPPLASLVNMHTDEIVALDDQSPSPERWAALLHDRVTGATMPMAPALLGLLRSLARAHPGARVELVSGYRSPKLNEMLRKKGHRVASHSQHSLGHAVDFRIVGLTPKQMRAEVRGLGWKGGVGQYDKPTDRFIHADVGRERSWHER